MLNLFSTEERGRSHKQRLSGVSIVSLLGGLWRGTSGALLQYTNRFEIMAGVNAQQRH
jgi:hypothetical protein